jgi:hypothetical protein
MRKSKKLEHYYPINIRKMPDLRKCLNIWDNLKHVESNCFFNSFGNSIGICRQKL